MPLAGTLRNPCRLAASKSSLSFWVRRCPIPRLPIFARVGWPRLRRSTSSLFGLGILGVKSCPHFSPGEVDAVQVFVKRPRQQAELNGSGESWSSSSVNGLKFPILLPHKRPWVTPQKSIEPGLFKGAFQVLENFGGRSVFASNKGRGLSKHVEEGRAQGTPLAPPAHETEMRPRFTPLPHRYRRPPVFLGRDCEC